VLFQLALLLCSQFAYQILEPRDALLKLDDLLVLSLKVLIHLAVQPLDGGQGNAVGIDGGDAFVIRPQAECGMKILGHGPHVRRSAVLFEIPARDGQGGDLIEDLAHVHRGEVLFGIAVAGGIEAGGGNVAAEVNIHLLGAIPKLQLGRGARADIHFPGRVAADVHAQAGVVARIVLGDLELRRAGGGGDVKGSGGIIQADTDAASGMDQELIG